MAALLVVFCRESIVDPHPNENVKPLDEDIYTADVPRVGHGTLDSELT